MIRNKALTNKSRRRWWIVQTGWNLRTLKSGLRQIWQEAGERRPLVATNDGQDVPIAQIDRRSSKLEASVGREISPKVGIIILNWNGWRDTIDCLTSVLYLTYTNYQLIVVDNGSRDESVKRIKAWAAENLAPSHVFTEYTQAAALQGGDEDREDAFESAPSKAGMVLIRNEENLGFTGGNNIAIHYALRKKYPVGYVFLLNNDAIVEKDCLTHLIDTAHETDAGIVGAVVLNRQKKEVQFAKSASFCRLFLAPIRTLPRPDVNSTFWTSPTVSGAGMLINSNLLDTIYRSRNFYLNPALFCYGEELELGFITQSVGSKSTVAGGAFVYHGTENHLVGWRKSIIVPYYFTRNRVLIANRVLPLHWRILFHLLFLPLSTRRVLKLTFLRERNTAWAIVCGLIDGYRGVTGQWAHHDRETLRDSAV